MCCLSAVGLVAYFTALCTIALLLLCLTIIPRLCAASVYSCSQTGLYSLGTFSGICGPEMGSEAIPGHLILNFLEGGWGGGGGAYPQIPLAGTCLCKHILNCYLRKDSHYSRIECSSRSDSRKSTSVSNFHCHLSRLFVWRQEAL